MSTWKTIAYGWAAALAVVTLPVQGQDAQSVKHASPELLKLADEFREFRSPLFRPRTWRPTHEVTGVPDYAAVEARAARRPAEVPERCARSTRRAGRCTTRSTIWCCAPRWTTSYFEQRVLREDDHQPGLLHRAGDRRRRRRARGHRAVQRREAAKRSSPPSIAPARSSRRARRRSCSPRQRPSSAKMGLSERQGHP